ncbi:MAG: ribonuclease J, partial [Anaerolineaceae bacterium]|nr:ribonuclease J [Anaerolineaceae bacterium]
PLGGLGEIGRNMMLYEYKDAIIIVDCGMMFPDNNMLGIDYIIPDFQYLRSRKDKILGIIFTHGHLDHIGAIHHLLQEVQAPVYGTRLTLGLVKVNLSRRHMLNAATLKTIKAGESIKLGPFNINFFHVCHSIPDSVGLGIETPEGLIVQSGDYKFDHTPVDNWPTDYSKLVEFSKKGVLALIADSTNATRTGWTPSEMVVSEAFDDVFKKAKNRIIIASFASLISRIQQAVNAAVAHNRKIAFVGTSMVENIKMAQELGGYLNIPKGTQVSINTALKLPDNEVVIMCTGSQGETTSILGRLARGTQRQFDIKKGDTVVLSSKTIPGNEEAVFSTINALFRRGANVIYEEVAPVHVSGHGSQEDLKLLINLTKPKYFIPAYGEMRHLKQAAILAQQTGIPENHILVVENGKVINVKGGKIKIDGNVSADTIFVDGSGVGELGMDEIRDRTLLSKDGIVLIHINLNKDNTLHGNPEIISRGFAASQDADEILGHLKQPVIDSLVNSNGNMEKNVIRTTKNYLYTKTRRKPTVLVTISKI